MECKHLGVVILVFHMLYLPLASQSTSHRNTCSLLQMALGAVEAYCWGFQPAAVFFEQLPWLQLSISLYVLTSLSVHL